MAVQVAACNPQPLAFANHVCRIDPLNPCPSRRYRSRPSHRAQPPLHLPVIGFDPVITITSGSLTAVSRDVSFQLEFSEWNRYDLGAALRHEFPRDLAG